MDISDIIFDRFAPQRVRQAVFDFICENEIFDASTPVLIPTGSNDDLNGSQHVTGGGTDFSYEDATEEQVHNASTLGYYEDFRAINLGGSVYTGNQYHGEGWMFAALVIDPPAYAATAVI